VAVVCFLFLPLSLARGCAGAAVRVVCVLLRTLAPLFLFFLVASCRDLCALFEILAPCAHLFPSFFCLLFSRVACTAAPPPPPLIRFLFLQTLQSPSPTLLIALDSSTLSTEERLSVSSLTPQFGVCVCGFLAATETAIGRALADAAVGKGVVCTHGCSMLSSPSCHSGGCAPSPSSSGAGTTAVPSSPPPLSPRAQLAYTFLLCQLSLFSFLSRQSSPPPWLALLCLPLRQRKRTSPGACIAPILLLLAPEGGCLLPPPPPPSLRLVQLVGRSTQPTNPPWRARSRRHGSKQRGSAQRRMP
jgi:hypothetical protein